MEGRNPEGKEEKQAAITIQTEPISIGLGIHRVSDSNPPKDHGFPQSVQAND